MRIACSLGIGTFTQEEDSLQSFVWRLASNQLPWFSGTMVAYLIIIKDVLPVLFHVDDGVGLKRIIMLLSSLVVIVPLSMQRDMADLEKTSRLNVVLDMCLVALVVVFSPIADAEGGILQAIMREPLFDLKTFFVGFGVCSFAFVCQDSSFIIAGEFGFLHGVCWGMRCNGSLTRTPDAAGSMMRPTRQRWKQVTRGAMLTCCMLELTVGISGYLAYRQNTLGNVLNNMNAHHWSGVATRAMLATTMFLAYPMNLYIARHALVLLVFQGTFAHEGVDSVALLRFDRRATLTWALYAATVLPAMLMESTGKVLAVTGAIAGSSIAYVGPGLTFLGIHSDSFITLIHGRWHVSSKYLCGYPENPSGEKIGNTSNTPQHPHIIVEEREQRPQAEKTKTSVLDVFGWYLFGMPVWSTIAIISRRHRENFEKEATMPNRLASNPNLLRGQASSKTSVGSTASNRDTEQVMLLQPRLGSTYGASGEVVTEPENCGLKWVDFRIAIAYIVLGVVAMIFGMVSVCLK